MSTYTQPALHNPMVLYHDVKEPLRPELNGHGLDQQDQRHESDHPGHHHNRILAMSVYFFAKWVVGALLLSALACVLTPYFFPGTIVVWPTGGSLFTRATESDGTNTFISQKCMC